MALNFKPVSNIFLMFETQGDHNSRKDYLSLSITMSTFLSYPTVFFCKTAFNQGFDDCLCTLNLLLNHLSNVICVYQKSFLKLMEFLKIFFIKANLFFQFSFFKFLSLSDDGLKFSSEILISNSKKYF